MNIAVLSDTHGILRPETAAILRNCDAALHAGDIDTPETLGQIRAALKPGVPFYVVRGNNDREWARELPEYAAFSLGGIRFYMAHRKKDIPENLGDRQIIIYGHSHRYAEEIRDHRLWLNPGSCGRRRFRLDLTMAVLHADGGNWSVERIDISEAGKGETQIPQGDLLNVIRQIMRGMDKGQQVKRIAADLNIDEEFTEQICRIRVTHPGVTAEGILNKIEVNRSACRKM